MAHSIDLIVEWWGGEEARRHADVQEQYLPSVLAQSPSLHTMLNGEPIGYAQSYVALEAGTDGGKKKPIDYAE